MAKAPTHLIVKMDVEDAEKYFGPLIEEVNKLRARVLELENIVIGDSR